VRRTHPDGLVERNTCIAATFEAVAVRRVAYVTAAAVAAATVLLLSLTACSNDPPNPNPRASEPLATVPVDLPR
jgi:hypothetical protein